MDWLDNPGERSEKIQVMHRTQVRNGIGEIEENWPVVDALWAKRIDKAGSEREDATQLVAREQVIWHIPYYTHTGNALSAGQFRFKKDDFIYDITHVREIGFRKVHEVSTVKYDADTFPEVLEMNNEERSYLEQQDSSYLKLD